MRPGGSAKAMTGGVSALTERVQAATSRPSRRMASLVPSPRSASAPKERGSRTRKGLTAEPRIISGVPPVPPETASCSRLPCGTVAAPPAASRKTGAAPV
jgi:hypothetical protein